MSKKVLTKKIDDFGLFFQAFLTIVMTILFIMSYFIEIFGILANITLACVFFTMSHNNERTYHKKYLTATYIIVGILIIIMAFMGV